MALAAMSRSMEARIVGTREAAPRAEPPGDWHWKARRVLARFGPRTVPALVEALSAGEDPAIRQFAAESLGHLGPDARGAAEALQHAAAHDADAAVRATAGAALEAVRQAEAG